MEPEVNSWICVFVFPHPYLINLHLSYDSRNGIGPLPRSIELIQKLACVNKYCAENLRTAYHKLKLTQDFSQVRVATSGSLSLWFPQIGQTFSYRWRRRRDQILNDNRFWLTSVDGQHNCPFELPDWISRNQANALELDQDYHNNPDRSQVEVRTAMEAWEVAMSNRIPIIPDTIKPLTHQRRVYNQINNIQDLCSQGRIIVPTITPKYRLAQFAVFDSEYSDLFDDTGQDSGKDECWLYLPYAELIAFYVSPEDMQHIIKILEQKGRTYPRVKQLDLSSGVLSLPNQQLAKLLIFFPRLLCIDCRDLILLELNTWMIEVFGQLWHR